MKARDVEIKQSLGEEGKRDFEGQRDEQMEERQNGGRDSNLKRQWKDKEIRWKERVDVGRREMNECLWKAVYPDYSSGFSVIKPHWKHFCDVSSVLWEMNNAIDPVIFPHQQQQQ